MADRHESPVPDDLTQEEASRIIHSHRKVRYGTACWPCRQRKVKCDNKHPCENCVKRDHAQLCSYKPNRPSSSAKNTSTTAPSEESHPTNVPKKRPFSPDESDGRRTSREPSTGSPIRVDADINEVSRYLGQNSIPALLREQGTPNHQEEGVEYIRQDMRSILGLDNSAPFPLMSSRHLDKLTLDISSELPSDREVMKLFGAYKEIPHPFWGFVLDIDDLETKLMVYLEERAKNAKTLSKPTKPVSASWLAILFSVMAVGSQYHDSPYHIRTRDSQKYIQISFHFLRLGNFLLRYESSLSRGNSKPFVLTSRPNLDSIQALLMTGFVLLNDMKAEASWALLGLTTRLAQSLGLDRVQNLDGRESPAQQKRDLLRRTLWWTIVWHDCLTSLSFDRPIPLGPTPSAGWNYLQGMYHLCQLIGKRLSPEVAASASYTQILDNCKEAEEIRSKMIPQLRTKEACRSALDRLHYFAIRLHTSFVVSVCCRPALRRSDSNRLTTEQKTFLAEKCKENLTETVRMFLSMHQLSVIPTRSWAFTYHGLSSAVLLGILGETTADLEVRGLQGDLINALSATAAKDKKSPPVYIHRTDRDIELSGPLSRALAALKNIYNHGSIAGQTTKNNDGSGSLLAAKSLSGISTATSIGTPLISHGQLLPGAVAPDGKAAISLSGGHTSLDPHQDAALAMAEMQNGGLDLGMFPLIQQQGSGDTFPDLSHIDPSTYMSPMDLYDQIFWGEQQWESICEGLFMANGDAENPEQWNMEQDSMNFDFIAQPPPGQSQQQFYF
ncbi:c6 zinc finger domain containing protein [Grosmannia clavigera kw1407]|uniref:C6 zinc finger domain containing protein n=1 Tax=Grosmannia clavigera (strain kw1407 / UAMH 11150) TaxID=655863 RepID=F0XPJ0_GROCL|nr:c6 zinc finger domain containing protein [Grosmannia clavigera kw1407]EFX00384.1 c6 zinc finger domain containing protein [Grosmannia clavigera kw1407]